MTADHPAPAGSTEPYDAVVLAGGAARRLGGTDKPGVRVGGRALLDRVLAACVTARTTVVVADARPTVRPVRWAREEPPGGGPVAALDAGLRHVGAPYAVVLSADLPFLEEGTVHRLLAALRAGDAEGVLLTDADGRDQPLVAAYRTAALRRALAELATPSTAPAGLATPSTAPAELATPSSPAPAFSPAGPAAAPGESAGPATPPGESAGPAAAPGERAGASSLPAGSASSPGDPAAPPSPPAGSAAPGIGRSPGAGRSASPNPNGRSAGAEAVVTASDAAAGPRGGLAGLALRRLTAALDLTRIPGPIASFDCDTWDDIATARARIREHGHVLDEWISAAKDELGIDLDVDIRLLLDLARDAAHGVDRPAAPLTTFLVGYAAARGAGGPEAVAEAARKAAALAVRWEKEHADAPAAEDAAGQDTGERGAGGQQPGPGA